MKGRKLNYEHTCHVCHVCTYLFMGQHNLYCLDVKFDKCVNNMMFIFYTMGSKDYSTPL